MAPEKNEVQDDVVEPFLNQLSSLSITRRDFFKAAAIGMGTGLVSAAGYGEESIAQELQRVVFRQSWTYSGKDAGFFAAKHRGLWSKAGIDVDIRAGTGSGDVCKLVGLARDEFGIADASTVMRSRIKGIPVKMIGLHLARSPMGWLSKAKTGVTKPKDFEGKSVGVGPGASSHKLFAPFCKINGVDPKKVELKFLRPAGVLSALLQDKIDVAGLYPVSFVPALKPRGFEEGKNLNVMRFYDYGFENLMGAGIITSDTIIKKRRDMVGQFTRAAMEGMRYAVKNPDEAVESILKDNPLMKREVALHSLKISFELFQTKEAEQHTLGWMSEEKWEWMQDLWYGLGEIKKKLPVQEYFTNEFLAGPPFKM